MKEIDSTLLLFLCLTLTEMGSTDSECIQSGPKTTVCFGGQAVSFDCTVCGGSTVYWVIDGMDAITLSNTELMAQSTFVYIDSLEAQSQLTFIPTISPVQNYTISCLVILGPRSNLRVEESDIATAIVQGILDAPGNLCAVLGNTSITLTWSPPYTLAPINCYKISWNGIGEIKVPGNESHYTFVFLDHGINRYEDQVITFSVHGCNPAGPGNNSVLSVNVSSTSNSSQGNSVSKGVVLGVLVEFLLQVVFA